MKGKGTLKRNIQIMDQETIRIDLTIQIEAKQWTESTVRWLSPLLRKTKKNNESIKKEAINESRKEHLVGEGESKGSGLITRLQTNNHYEKYRRLTLRPATKTKTEKRPHG